MTQIPPNFILSTSQLGFRPASPKPITLIPPAGLPDLPDEIPFYLQAIGDRRKRIHPEPAPKQWAHKVYRWPYEISRGKYKNDDNASKPDYLYKGTLHKTQSRWGTFWQGDFTDFDKNGIYQIETEYAFTTPFVIEPRPYERLFRGYLTYLYCQRSGFDVPGIRDAQHLDDAVLDSDGSQIDGAAGWYDAGDVRKWLAFTQSNIEGLSNIYKSGHKAFRQQVIDEIRWGNRLFHNMINPEGMVYEDIGGGKIKQGFDYDTGWWCENHPGCIADNSGNVPTDNIRQSGDERLVRTKYNPWCQFEFIKNQSIASTILPEPERSKCLKFAERAWQYNRETGHDNRTIFIAAELRAAVELIDAGSSEITEEQLSSLAEKLLTYQDTGDTALSGYFLEKDAADGYRSLGFTAVAPMALLRFCGLNLKTAPELSMKCQKAIEGYIDNFLLADAKSNPFNVTPYGIYIDPPHRDLQLFRDAGRDRFVRTFIHPFNQQCMAHPCGAVWMDHAHLLARAAGLFSRPQYKDAAEHLLQWMMGHNTVGLCLFTGVGFKHPIPFSAQNIKVPDACICGFIGRPDDTPYLETSNAVEWNTQEIWDTSFFHAVGAMAYLQ